MDIARQIAEIALEQAVQHECRGLLEIGPGKGAITLPILERWSAQASPALAQNFLLVERDFQLAANWAQTDSQPFSPKVIEGNFLDLLPEQWLHQKPLAVVSNLPYSVGTAILDLLARRWDEIPVMVLMFQSEVAQRLRAAPSTSKRGSLSVWIQNRWDVQKMLDVPPRAFLPPPDVHSEVVMLTRRKTPWVSFPADEGHEQLWEKVLKTCFAHRRKMLRSILPWRNVLEEAGVDGTKRAEALQWQEWDSLFQAVRRVTLL